MQKQLFVALLATASLALSACNEVETPGGRVPAQYLEQARQLMGTYNGNFEGVATTIELYLDGDQPRALIRNMQGNDLLGANCGSQVGLLRSIEAEKDDGVYYLEDAHFRFDPNMCNIEGRTLSLSFAQNQRSFSASIVRDSYTEEHCSWDHSGDSPSYNCNYYVSYNYLTGKFDR